jgi:hypothetical protein
MRILKHRITLPQLILIVAVFWTAKIGDKALAQDPDSLWGESVSKFDRGDYHGVISNIDSLMQMLTEFPEGYYNKGIARMKLGDIKGACYDLQMARETGLQNTDVINFLCDKERIRDFLVKEYYGNIKVIPETGYRPDYGREDSLRGSMRHERSCFDVSYYDLTVKINPHKRKINGSNKISFDIVEDTRKKSSSIFLKTFR